MTTRKQKWIHEVHSWLCSVAAKAPPPHGQFYDLRLVKDRREDAVICTNLSENLRSMLIKLLFLLFKGKLYSILAKTYHPQRKRRKKNNNNKTLLFIEAHQLIGILPPSICTSPPQSWQPKASLLPLWWQQRNRDHAIVDHHYRAARNRSSQKWNHSLGRQWNKITPVI